MGNPRSALEVRRRARIAGMVLAVLSGPVAALCQQAAPALPALTADQVVHQLVAKNKERAASLQHYSAMRTYRLEYRGFPRSAEAEMLVKVEFDAPGPKHFTVVSTAGPKLIESRVFSRLLESEQQASDVSNRVSTEIGPANYQFSLAGIEGTSYVLDVEPKQDSKFLYRGKIWVDGHDFAVTRIEAQPARNPSFLTAKSLIHHTYQKVDGGFYLPREDKTVTSVRLGGTATLTIDCNSYQVTAASPAVAAKKPATQSDGSLWPDGGLNMELASFAGGKK